MELQRQFLDEIVCPNQVATPTADQNVEAEGSEKSTSSDKEDETDFTGKENFTTPCCGPGSRKESGQGKPVLYHYKTENIITAHFKLVVLRGQKARCASSNEITVPWREGNRLGSTNKRLFHRASPFYRKSIISQW